MKNLGRECEHAEVVPLHCLKTTYFVLRRFEELFVQLLISKYSRISLKIHVWRINLGDSDFFDITVRARWCRIFLNCMLPWIPGPCTVRKKLNMWWVFVMFFRMYRHLLQMTLFAKVLPLSVSMMKLHYFRFILPSFLHIFTVHKIPIILSLLFCFRDVSSLTWRTCSLRVLPFSVSMITLHYFRFK